MLVTKWYSIANTTLSSSWISLIIALVAAYVVVRIRYGKKISLVFSDALFYLIIVWKLSVIVTDFSSVIKSPLSILYFHGGLVGFYIGLLAACIRVMYEVKKKGLVQKDLYALFIGFIVVQAVYQVMMVFLNEGELITQIVTVVGFTIFLLFAWKARKLEVTSTQLALLFSAIHIFIAAFQPAGIFVTPVISTFVISLFFIVFLFRNAEVEIELED